MRILHVVTSLRAEGTPRLVLDWLSSGDHEQGVAALASEPDDLIADFRETGCWLRMGHAIRPGPRKFLEIARFSRRCVAEFRPDLVIAWPAGFSHWIFLGARAAMSRARLLSHAGNPPGEGWYRRYPMTWICFWLTAVCGGKVVACSRHVQALYQQIPLVPKKTLSFAYNSVRPEAISRRAQEARDARRPDGVFRAVMVATLEGHKDHATLIRAARLLQDRGLAVEILLAGSGALEADLRALADELGVNGTVKFLGTRRDVPEILGQSDLFVLSTTPKEGRPGVIMEAMAAGLPIVASDVAPLREILEDGKWGLLVPPADPVALADAIAAAARSADPAAAFNPGLQVHASSFSVARMMESYLQIAAL